MQVFFLGGPFGGTPRESDCQNSHSASSDYLRSPLSATRVLPDAVPNGVGWRRNGGTTIIGKLGQGTATGCTSIRHDEKALNLAPQHTDSALISPWNPFSSHPQGSLSLHYHSRVALAACNAWAQWLKGM